MRFNFILSNGTRSNLRDEGETLFDHFIPADAIKRTRSVTIHYDPHLIAGFSFFDKDGALLWKIGRAYREGVETVVLAENEVIVGVVAKLHCDYQSMYTDLQFQIALE